MIELLDNGAHIDAQDNVSHSPCDVVSILRVYVRCVSTIHSLWLLTAVILSTWSQSEWVEMTACNSYRASVPDHSHRIYIHIHVHVHTVQNTLPIWLHACTGVWKSEWVEMLIHVHSYRPSVAGHSHTIYIGMYIEHRSPVIVGYMCRCVWRSVSLEHWTDWWTLQCSGCVHNILQGFIWGAIHPPLETSFPPWKLFHYYSVANQFPCPPYIHTYFGYAPLDKISKWNPVLRASELDVVVGFLSQLSYMITRM